MKLFRPSRPATTHYILCRLCGILYHRCGAMQHGKRHVARGEATTTWRGYPVPAVERRYEIARGKR